MANEDDNPQYGQRGAEKAYQAIRKKLARHPKQNVPKIQPQISQPQIPQVSQAEILRKRRSELVAKVDELEIDFEKALAEIPQKRELLGKLGYKVREMWDLDVGRLLRQEYAQGQIIQKPLTRESQ